MRVLMINTLYPPLISGGAEKSVSLLAESLVRAGDTVSVISQHGGRETTFEVRNGVRVYRVPLMNLYWPFGRGAKPGRARRVLWHLLDMWNWRAAREVGRIIDIEKPDVVHTNNIAGFSVAVFNEVKRRQIRLVHTLRDYYMLCARYSLFRNGKICEARCGDCKLLTSNRKLLSLQVDAVVANSEYVLRAHERHGWFQGVPGSVIFNIAENHVASSGMHVSGSPAAVQAATEAGADDSLVFGFIGKLNQQKGIEILLLATTLLARSKWRLRIAGIGLEEYVADLKRRYPDPRIEWLGFAEPTAFYRSINVCVVASVWAEPLPRTLIEAFTAGRSAICAASGGILEIASMGKVVETYDADDAVALARLMDGAMGDVARWRGGGWRDDEAATNFSEAAVTRRYRAVYRGVAPALEREAELVPYSVPVVVDHSREKELV